MKVFFHQNYENPPEIEEDLTLPSLKDDMKKTRSALEVAYPGFDHAVDVDMVDSYIFQINALQKRYAYLLSQVSSLPETAEDKSYAKSPVRARVGHVFS
jgi:hypothetical protein